MPTKYKAIIHDLRQLEWALHWCRNCKPYLINLHLHAGIFGLRANCRASAELATPLNEGGLIETGSGLFDSRPEDDGMLLLLHLFGNTFTSCFRMPCRNGWTRILQLSMWSSNCVLLRRQSRRSKRVWYFFQPPRLVRGVTKGSRGSYRQCKCWKQLRAYRVASRLSLYCRGAGYLITLARFGVILHLRYRALCPSQMKTSMVYADQHTRLVKRSRCGQILLFAKTTLKS